MAIKILSRMRLPIAPVLPDEVARKADVDNAAVGGHAGQLPTGSALTVTQEAGGWPVGATISATDTVWDVIQRLLDPHVGPSYVAPVITLSGTMPLAHEIGENITPILTPSFQQNDGGAVEAYRLYRGGAVVFDNPTLAPHTDTTFQLIANQSYQAQVDHGEGPIKNDSKGNPDPIGQIPAGTITSAAVTYTPQRRAIFGALADATIPNNSAFIRSLSGSTLNPGNNTQLVVDVVPGNRGVCFAYPETLREVTTIVQQGLGIDVKSGFTQATVLVEGANGFTAISYRVYYIINEFPFTGTERFTATI